MQLGVDELAEGLIALHRLQRLTGASQPSDGAPSPGVPSNPSTPPTPPMGPGDLLYKLSRFQTAQAKLMLQFASEQANQAFERIESRQRFPTVRLDLKPSAGGFEGEFTARNDGNDEAIYSFAHVGTYDDDGESPATTVVLSPRRVRLAVGAERIVTIQVSLTANGKDIAQKTYDLEVDVLRDDGASKEPVKVQRVFARFGGPIGR